MKKVYFILTALIAFFATVGLSSVQAQGIEQTNDSTTTSSDPTQLSAFTPYFDENTGANQPAVPHQMPGDLIMANSPAVAVTPNPTTDEVMMVWYNELIGTSRVELLDIKGQVHATAEVGDERHRSGNVTFHVANLVPGVYFVRLTSGMYSSIEKVLIH